MGSSPLLHRWPFSIALPLLFLLFTTAQGHTSPPPEEEAGTIADEPAESPEIVDVLIVNPTFSSFNEQPPNVSHRELLLRQLQQGKKPRQSSTLTRHRHLRPYFQPVPKAKAIPGPILAKSGKDNILKGKQLDVVNAQSTAGLRREQGRVQLVNGGGDDDEYRAAGEEVEPRPKQRHSNEYGEDALIWPRQGPRSRKGDHPTEEADLSPISGKWTMKTRLRSKPLTSSKQKPSISFNLDSQPEQQHQQKQQTFGQPKSFGQLQKSSQPILAKLNGPGLAKVGNQQFGPIRQQQKKPSHAQSQQQLHFYYTPSQTTVNQDFTFASDTPGLVCAYGMPVPIYNTPRKQCIPSSPLCGLAFTCLMDVHAMDQSGQLVDNWWTLPTGQTSRTRPAAAGAGAGLGGNGGQFGMAMRGGLWPVG